MSSKIFNVSFPIELVEIIDSQAKLHYATRNEYIKNTILDRLKADGVIGPKGEINIKTPDQLRSEQLKEFLKNNTDIDDNEDYEF